MAQPDPRPASEVVHGAERVRRILFGAPLVLLGVGFSLDACSGMPVSRTAQSPQAWLGGLLGLGGLYLMTEGAIGWLSNRDSVSDPIWKRGLHLVAILAVWGLMVLGAELLLMLVQ